ncbi:MAG: TlyA family RNA methyltransferase [Myxococcota bacterium]|nr:TlyA family rRNA (cytidine-2'-O)-methyltransferase [Deltaproteobacteria bacterium]MCP4240410.1 TlyA family RNA methyltransferase [bacterium]MDP6074774.1 TlyA family RNA methyltransferase [Myxococcota bacterium]MDP6243935.1 TlyA family RNA methyltransferase [Myxococcota bacterium]MDP7076315.1 TlyA family RNA methyltransferase [Myxococcota bacterium]
MRTRLDRRLVEEGLAPTRTRAEALIRAGRVLVDDTPVEKPGTAVKPEAQVRVRGGERRFVSRGGEKLAGALADLGVDVRERLCLDVGSSTGGFTDCLLRAGARHVVGVDVGYGQLDPALREDPRVTVLERTNARTLGPGDVPDGIELVTVDVSFISARRILPALRAVAQCAELLILVKPQFEVGRERVGKGGVVRDEALRVGAAASVQEAAELLGWRAAGQADSCLRGPRGNLEIFLWLIPQTAGHKREID